MTTNRIRTLLLSILTATSFLNTSASSSGQLLTPLRPDLLTNLLIKSYQWGKGNPAQLATAGVAAAALWKLKRPLLAKIEDTFPTLYGVAQGSLELAGSAAFALFASYHLALGLADSLLQVTVQNTVFTSIFTLSPFIKLLGKKFLPGMDDSLKKEKDERAKESLKLIPKPKGRISKEEVCLMYGDTIGTLIDELAKDREQKVEDQQGVQILAHGLPGTGKSYLGEILQELTGYPMLSLDATDNSSPIALGKYVAEVETGFRALGDRVQHFHEKFGNNLIVLLDETDPHLRQMINSDKDESKKTGDSENKNLNGFLKKCREWGVVIICTSNLKKAEINKACIRRFTADEYRAPAKATGPGNALEIKSPTDEARIAMVDEQLKRKLIDPAFKQVIVINKPDFVTYVAGQLKGATAFEIATAVSKIFSGLQDFIMSEEKWLAADKDHPRTPTLKPIPFIDIKNPAFKRLVDHVLMTSGHHTNQDPAQAYSSWKERVKSVIGTGENNLSEKQKEVKITQLKELCKELYAFRNPYSARLEKIDKQLENAKTRANRKTKPEEENQEKNPEFEQNIKRLKKEKKELKKKTKTHKKKFPDLHDLYYKLKKLSPKNFDKFAKKYKTTELENQARKVEDASYLRTCYALAQLKNAQASRDQLVQEFKPSQLLKKAQEYADSFTGNNINQESARDNKLNSFPLNTIFTPIHRYDKYNRSNIYQHLKQTPSKIEVGNYYVTTFIKQLIHKLLFQTHYQMEVQKEQRIGLVGHTQLFPFLSSLNSNKDKLYRLLDLRYTEFQEGSIGTAINTFLRILRTYNPLYRIYNSLYEKHDLKQTSFEAISTELYPFLDNDEECREAAIKIYKEVALSNYSHNLIDKKIAEAILGKMGWATKNISVSRNDKDELVINGQTTTQLKKIFKQQKQLKLQQLLLKSN